MKLSRSEAKRLGKENMRFQWGASLLILVIYAALIACGNVIPVIGSLLILGPLNYGLNYVFYKASFKEKINYWDIFRGFESEFGENFLAQLLTGLFSFLWGLLFIIPGIVKGYSYSMTMYLLMREPELDAFSAIDKSRAFMSGNKWRLFMFDLSYLGWDILTALTAGLLSIYVAPYRQHAKMLIFNDIYEQKTAEGYQKPEPKETIDSMFVIKPAEEATPVEAEIVEEPKEE